MTESYLDLLESNLEELKLQNKYLRILVKSMKRDLKEQDIRRKKK